MTQLSPVKSLQSWTKAAPLQFFGRFTADIQEQEPEQALGWITQQYENLVGSCGAAN